MERALLAEDRHVVAAAQAAPEPTGVDKVKAEMQMLFDKTAAKSVSVAGEVRGKLGALGEGARPLLDKTASDTAQAFDFAADFTSARGAQVVAETRALCAKTAAGSAQVAGKVQDQLRTLPTEATGTAVLAAASAIIIVGVSRGGGKGDGGSGPGVAGGDAADAVASLKDFKGQDLPQVTRGCSRGVVIIIIIAW